MSALLYLLLGWLLTVATAVAIGGHVLRCLRLKLEGWEALIYRFLLGSAALSLVVFGLACAGVVHKGVVFAVAGVAIASSWRDWPRLSPPWHWSAIPFAVYCVLYLTHAMAPEHSPDGMSYHLGLVARYYREHGFVWFASNMYAYLSQGLEMLFLFAFAIGRHSAAALVHFTFLLTLPALLAVHAGRRGWLAGLLVFLLPVVGIDGVSAYNDVALAVVLLAVYHAVERWKQTREPAFITVAAVLVGFAFAIKFTGFIAVALLLPAWRLWPRWGWAAVCALPWLIKSWWWTGNPLAPFFNAWFPNPWFNAEFEAGYRSFLRHYDLPNWQEWMREVFVGGPRLSGTLGPLALVLPLGLLAARRNPSAAFAAVLVLALYPLNVGTRFLIPALPFLALLLSELSPRLMVALPALAAVLSWPSVLPRYASPYTWFLEKMPWRAALRIETEDGFLVRKVGGGYVTARLIEQFVPAGETVFALSPIPESYTIRNIIVAYQSTLGLQLRDALIAPIFPDFQPRFVYACPGPELRITKSVPDTWSINEIEPRPESIRCNRQPWDAGLATDQNSLSRWRTWGAVNAGDACTLSPAQPYRLHASGDQWQVELAGCTRTIVAPTENFREATRQFFLSRNVRYLAVDGPDFPSRDIREHPELWPLDFLAERGTMRLYRWRP